MEKGLKLLFSFVFYGARGRNRTTDTRIFNPSKVNDLHLRSDHRWLSFPVKRKLGAIRKRGRCGACPLSQVSAGRLRPLSYDPALSVADDRVTFSFNTETAAPATRAQNGALMFRKDTLDIATIRAMKAPI